MRQAALLVALVCVLVVPAAGSAGVAGPSEQPSLAADERAQQALQENASLTTEGVDITVQIRADGNAHWSVSSKYTLDGANDTAAFEELREEFEAYETDSEFSVDVFRAVAPDVSDAVGRSMEVREPTRSSTVVSRGNNTTTGVLSIEFTWTNFSQVGNETLVVDSFTGGWFGDLKAGQQLTIRPPEGYDTDQVQPGPDSISNGAYKWTGEVAFASGEPRAVFSKTEPSEQNSGVSLVMVAGVGALALLVGAILVWAYYRGRPSGLSGGFPSVSALFGGDDDDGPPDAPGPAPGEPDGGASGAAATSEPADEAVDADDEASDDTDPELLSDEERVERLLREHGGRMKQSKIVEETRWSTAKVSQLLSSMDEAGRVEKLRIGRENLISLPDEDVGEE